MGETVAEAMGRLHDRVEPMSVDQALQAVQAGLGRIPSELRPAFADPPVASGSMACVYRAEHDGRPVAVKVRRPDVGAAVRADIAVLRRMAGAAARLPAFRRVPLTEIVRQVGDCLVAQLDFQAEAANLRLLHDHFAGTTDVIVPDIVPELCGDGVITMEFVDGLDRGVITEFPPPVRWAAVTALVRAVYRMLFIEGLVHVDLHQGNAYFMPDGTVVLLDAGFVFRMGERIRREFTEFFGGMIRGDGELCADILLSTVRRVDLRADIAAFRRNVADLVEGNVGKSAGEFNLSAFCVGLFELQRRYGLHAEPEFVFPMLCLLTLEGTVRRHHPLLDFQLEAAPFAMEGLLLAADADS